VPFCAARLTTRIHSLIVSDVELLGAHVSTAGGLSNAPARGTNIGATAIQVFTTTPSQWREPRISEEEIARYESELGKSGVRVVVSHSSYLINLASPDTEQRARSIKAFKRELERCRDLGIRYVVTHPGNFMDERVAGIKRNAVAYGECLETVDGPIVLVETTAGSGTALGSTFEELAELRHLVPAGLRPRVAFCADTCHLYSAGYDLVNDWDGVWTKWNEIIGLEHLLCLHLNDSKNPFGSRRDRHECIAEGTLGPQPFRRVMRDRRFRAMIKVIETPKGDEPVRQDRRMLRRLRAYGRTT